MSWAAGDVEVLELHPCQDVTLRGGDTAITLNTRLAGATWSMTYRGRELVLPQPGNGGSMQTACSFDIRPGQSSELENPTEAGNANDSGGATSSRWDVCRVNPSRTEAYTETQMAYYWPPGRPMEAGPNAGQPPRNTAVLSHVRLAKHLVFLGPDLLQYRVSFCLGPQEPPHWFAQFEALTGYMHPEALPLRWRLRLRDPDWTAVEREPIPEGVDACAPCPGRPCEGVLYASRDGAAAFGVACTDWPPGGHPYGGLAAAPPWAGSWAAPYKWNVVHHFNAQVSPESDRIPRGPFGYRFLIATGDVERVAQAITTALLSLKPRLEGG